MITLENRTRSVFQFPTTELIDDDGDVREIAGPVLQLGDARDLDIPDDKRAPSQPSPVLRFASEAEYKALGARNLRFLDGLVRDGQVTRIGI